MLILTEVVWPIISGHVEPHGGYALFSALCRRGLVFHRQPETIVIPAALNLVIRCPAERARQLVASGVEGLCVRGRRVVLGEPTMRPLQPSDTLKAWCCTIKGMRDDQSFRSAARRQLDHMGVMASIRVLERQVVRVADNKIVGYGVRLTRLSHQDSLIVQSRGIGGRLRMGCGGFVPC